MRVTIVGGGILGTGHALEAVRRGHEVVQLEREAEAPGATVRNFGLVWVSGRAHGEFAGGDADCRGFTLLDPDRVRALNPALRGRYLAGLHCSLDAAVESRQALPAMREHTFIPGAEARSVDGQTVADDRGVRFRYYPGFVGEALNELRRNESQDVVADEHRMQLLCVQRLHGGLTIGDTHEYDEPFDFDVSEPPYAYLVDVVEQLLGRALPPLRQRWAGVYSQCIDPDLLVCRTSPEDGVWVITGPGGRGMTLAPALAEQTADLIGL